MSRKFLDNCTYSVHRLLKQHSNLAFTTKHDYSLGIKQMVRALHQGGYQISNIAHLKPRHAEHLLKQWQEQGLSVGTLKNRLSQLRFVFRAIGKEHHFPKLNDDLGIGRRSYVSLESKAIHEIDVNQFTDPYIRYSIQLQQHFGLRREEAIKFIGSQADKGGHITLQASWTKGGVERNIPITTPEQRALLDSIKAFVGRGHALIPEGKTYASQRNFYDFQVYRSGYHNLHGLRHAYAQRRYEQLTNQLTHGHGWASPHNGGKMQKDMTPEERTIDRQTRLLVSNELGHSREQVTKIYA